MKSEEVLILTLKNWGGAHNSTWKWSGYWLRKDTCAFSPGSGLHVQSPWIALKWPTDTWAPLGTTQSDKPNDTV